MAIHDVASGRLIARTTVRTPFRDVSTVTDSLALAVLRSLWDRDPAITRTPGASRASPGPAALATRSLPALRAFLAGEQAIAEVRGDEAAAHFARAFALDSTYWFAYWRYAQIRSAWHAPVEPHVRASYEAHRHSFPERDRLLIEARMSSPLSDRLARTRAVTQRFQDFALAWFEYANLLVHDGPFLGTTRADAREALDRALALTPADLVVLQHLFWIAAAEGDTATSGFVLRRIRDVRAATPGFIAPQPDELDLFVLVDALARSDGDPIPAVGAIERAVAPFIDYRGSIPLERVTMGLSMYGFHRAQIAIGEQFLAADVPRTLKAGQMGAIAMAWAGRGAWDSAIAAGARAYRAFPDAKAALRMLRLATAAEWLGALPAGTADQWSATLKIRDDQFDAFSRFEVVWLDGVRAAARGDRTGLTDARQRLAGPNAGDGSLPEAPADVLSDTILERSVPRMLATSLAAFERALAGDATGAADLMVDLERERADQWWTKMYGNMHPLLTAVNRITAARWLRETGRAGEAATLLRWHEAVQVPAQLAADIDAMLDAIIFFERARTAEALGRINDARRFDREFLRRYDMPVPAHRHLVERLGFPTQS
jgi:tetratricopeptide (TPR) repeat protein